VCRTLNELLGVAVDPEPQGVPPLMMAPFRFSLVCAPCGPPSGLFVHCMYNVRHNDVSPTSRSRSPLTKAPPRIPMGDTNPPLLRLWREKRGEIDGSGAAGLAATPRVCDGEARLRPRVKDSGRHRMVVKPSTGLISCCPGIGSRPTDHVNWRHDRRSSFDMVGFFYVTGSAKRRHVAHGA
jgi:hypothetical protein